MTDIPAKKPFTTPTGPNRFNSTPRLPVSAATAASNASRFGPRKPVGGTPFSPSSNSSSRVRRDRDGKIITGGPGSSNNRGGGAGFPKGRGGRDRKKEVETDNLDTQVIAVRRVTKVVKGGKNMKFSALVVVGDKNGKVGYGLKKGLDYQDAVAKATKKAKENMVKITLNNDFSIDYTLKFKYKACEIFLKPAKSGSGLIAGGFLRPVLELAGVQNIYSKVLRSRNKVVGVQTAISALSSYQPMYKKEKPVIENLETELEPKV